MSGDSGGTLPDGPQFRSTLAFLDCDAAERSSLEE
jgi:hypothetical protein